jgi:hypothetical protein
MTADNDITTAEKVSKVWCTYTFVFSFFLSLAITLPSIDMKQIWPYINNLAIVVAMTN